MSVLLMLQTAEDIIELPDPDNYFGHSDHHFEEFHLSCPSIRMKKNQVVRACVHCKRLHAKCSNERPCIRCTHNGLADSCVDSPRKPRVGKSKGGVKYSHKGRTPVATSVFSDPQNLVMTGLDGSKALPNARNWNTASLSEEDIFIPAVKSISPSPNSSPIFKTDRIDSFFPSKQEAGSFSDMMMNGNMQRIYLPEDEGGTSYQSNMISEEGCQESTALQSPFTMAV